MFDNIVDALSYVESKRSKRSFDEFKETINKYNINTNLGFTIHVAGTNGKGSTVNYMRELLMAHDYSVATFTSPYIINHNDRICINDIPISDELLLNYINISIDMIEEEGLSMFEIDVIIMLKYFNDNKSDVYIIETGIGGRFDKTNVINSDISVITNIGYDHEFMLGNTLEEIASHKIGIIKKNTSLYTTESNQQILDYFKNECDKLNVSFHPILTIRGKGYQRNNFKLANDVVYSFMKNLKSEEEETKLRIEIFNNLNNKCRFERIDNYILDGAHNIMGIEALIESIKLNDLKDVVIVFSSLGDKDRTRMLDLLKDYEVNEVYFDDERSVNNGLYYKDALSKLNHENIVVTGSLHFVSTVRKYIKEELLNG